MDPDQVLKEIEQYRISDPRQAERISKDLSLWLARGLARPNWYLLPDAARFYQKNSARTYSHAWNRLHVSSVTAWGIFIPFDGPKTSKTPEWLPAGRLIGNWSQDFLTLSLQISIGPLKERALSPTYSIQIGLIDYENTDALFGYAFSLIIKQLTITDKNEFKDRGQVKKWLISRGYHVIKVLE